MWAVVNEAGGTAPIARVPIPGVQLAGKTGSTQVRRVSREAREHGFKSENLPWEFRPHALFVCYAPYDAPRYAVSRRRRARQRRRRRRRAARPRHHGRRPTRDPVNHTEAPASAWPSDA